MRRSASQLSLASAPWVRHNATEVADGGSRPAISLWEHRLALKRLREDGRMQVDEAAIFRTVETMRAIADDAVHTSKKARRQRARRLLIAPAVQRELPQGSLADTDICREAGEEQQPHERMFQVEEW
jgi:putative transposase